MKKLRPIVGRFVRWLFRSGHRISVTRQLRPTVEALQGTVLDIGGGTDSILAAYWRGTARRVRLDVELVPPPDIGADAIHLPVASSSVDGVLMSEVLEHVADPWTAVSEVHRVLRPGGIFVGSVPFMSQGIHADPQDWYRYTDTALYGMLQPFCDVEVIPHGNGFGVAWRMTLARLRPLVILNPLMRQMSRVTDREYAEGFTFRARKPSEDSD